MTVSTAPDPTAHGAANRNRLRALAVPRLLLLDAGNTVVFLDFDAVSAVTRDCGVPVAADVLREREAESKRRYEQLLRGGGSHEDGWGLYVGTLLEIAGVAPRRVDDLVAALRREHDAFNLWRSVPRGLPAALARIRDLGVRVAVVSNSEGHLPELFARVGLSEVIEMVIDSHDEGIRKPDPEIFRRALRRLDASPGQALYVGDIPAVDIEGARAAGIEAVLVDPFGHYAGYEAAPRVASVVELVDALWPT